MFTASRVPAVRASRLAVVTLAILLIGAPLASCSAPPDLSKTSDREQEQPAGSKAARDEDLKRADEADRGNVARYERPPPPPGAGQGAPAPMPQNAPPIDPDASGAGASPPKTSVAPRPYRYEAPGSGGATSPPPIGGIGQGAPAPQDYPAPSARAPRDAATRDLGSSGQPRSIAPAPASPGPASPAPVAADAAKTFDVVPVFYGTDRAIEPNPARLHYGPERGLKLQLGRAMITVPTAHKVPNIERPWVVEIPYFKVKVYEEKEDTAKHFTVQELAAMTEGQLLALVKQRLQTSASFKDHAIVFVHGFNTSFDNALYRTAQIAYDLKFDGAPFVYSWPSGGKVASYTYDRGSAEQAEPHLADFLKMVVEKSGAKSISLIAHSMGNELLLRVLERDRPVAPKGVVISQVILAAPDVDRDKFSNIAKQITSFSQGVTLYAASNDRALGYSARFWGGVPRAGDVPESGPMIVKGVDTIDVTAVSTDSLGLNHSGYAENQELLNDVKALIHDGVRPPDKRLKSLLTVQSSSGVFWRFPPAIAPPR